MKEIDTCLLFGAGVETSFGLCKGADFAKIVVGLPHYDKYKSDLKDFYKDISDKDSWFPSHNLLESKISEEKLFKAACKKTMMKTRENIKTKTDVESDIKEKWEVVDKECEPTRTDIINRMIEENTSYMEVLDSKFHTMIAPRVLGPQKFWQVIDCYWRAYLCLAENMMDDLSNLDKMKNPKLAYEKMVEFAKSKQLDKTESYYSILREYRNLPHNSKTRVITTNYTPLCEVMCGFDKSEVAYVNGSFRWFEKPQKLEVFDTTDENIDYEIHDYFPFIFLQSGVKPIVHPIQLNEYKKCMDFLEISSRLIIVGYQANCDDNHLNSIIREYIKHKKQVIYLLYDTEDKKDDDTEDAVYLNLCLEAKTEFLSIVKINSENCYEKFKEILYS